MPRITKIELQQTLARLGAELQAARVRISELEGDKAALAAQLERLHAQRAATASPAIVAPGPAPAPRPAATVFEFDPNKPGDHQRARELARITAARTGRMCVVRRSNHG